MKRNLLQKRRLDRAVLGLALSVSFLALLILALFFLFPGSASAAAQDLLTGFIFFVFEVIVIALFLGRILEWQREKRWKGARALLGERLWDLNEQFDLWWSKLRPRALDESAYDGVVRTPEIFDEFDTVIVQFGFAMNPEIAIAYSKYRRELGRFETLYRRLCISFGGNTVGNMIRYARDIRADGTVSFRDLTDAFIELLNTLGYEPVLGTSWWEPERFMEAKSGPKDLIDIRQEQADFIIKHAPAVGSS